MLSCLSHSLMMSMTKKLLKGPWLLMLVGKYYLTSQGIAFCKFCFWMVHLKQNRSFDPLLFGEYPPEMRDCLGTELPTFTAEETELIKDSIDFLGINHYGTLYAKDCLHGSCVCSDSHCSKGSDRAIRGYVISTPIRDGVLIGEPVWILLIHSCLALGK